MPYSIISESTPLMALIIILASVLIFVLRKFSENMTTNREQTENTINNNNKFVRDVIDKYEKREEKLMKHFDKLDDNQSKITITLDKINNKFDMLNEKIQRIEVDYKK